MKKAQIKLVSPSPERAPNLEPRDNIFPANDAPILCSVEGGVELLECRWGLIPSYHKDGIKDFKLMTTNARSDNLAESRVYRSSFEKRRCLVPADQFYEWTGEKSHKTKWSFSRKDGDWFCFAGLWDKAETKDGEIQSFTIITTDAGADMKPYHHRQPVILEAEHYQNWLSGEATDKLLVPSPAGLLIVTEAPTERGVKCGETGSLF